jgi:hypothetical protein
VSGHQFLVLGQDHGLKLLEMLLDEVLGKVGRSREAWGVRGGRWEKRRETWHLREGKKLKATWEDRILLLGLSHI